jgi:hypothetical protein
MARHLVPPRNADAFVKPPLEQRAPVLAPPARQIRIACQSHNAIGERLGVLRFNNGAALGFADQALKLADGSS